MPAFLLDCAVRAALVAFGTAAVLGAMRVRRAAACHAAWTGVVLVMLTLPLWSIAGPKVPLPVLRPPQPAAASHSASPAAPLPIVESVKPGVHTPAVPAAPSPVRLGPTRLAGLVYILGVVLLLTRLAIGTVHARRLRRAATIREGVATTDLIAAPITIGWFAPLPLLPPSWREWPRAKLNAVLTHEREHARRRDPLVQWIALLNRAIFWFHPLAWWLERRLATLAEESCDAAVLAAGHPPDEYSTYLLDFARSIALDRRVRAGAMAMPGGGLRRRVHQILDGVPPRPLSRGRVAATAALCTVSTALFAGVNPTARLPVASRQQIAQPAAKPRFDAASVRPCEPTAEERARRSDGRHIEYTAHRLYLECFTPDRIVNFAYVRRGEYRLTEDLERQVRGGPDWIRSDRFTVEATIPDKSETATIALMLQALLEDAFKLRTHGVSEDVPMYALAVARDGLRIKPIAEGGCSDDEGQPPKFGPGRKPPCGAIQGTRRGQMRVWDLGGASLADLSSVLDADRQIVDRTGVAGRFNIHLEYMPETDVAGERPEFAGPTIFKALEDQLGLQLVSIKGSHEYVVIDRIERPADR